MRNVEGVRRFSRFDSFVNQKDTTLSQEQEHKITQPDKQQ